MKIIKRIETFDGVVHDDIEAAERHLRKLHADALGRIAHELVKLEKYVQMGDWVDQNLGRFLDLHAIKQDMQLVDEQDEE